MPKFEEFEADELVRHDIETLCEAAENWAWFKDDKRREQARRQLLEAAITFCETLKARKPKESKLKQWYQEEG